MAWEISLQDQTLTTQGLMIIISITLFGIFYQQSKKHLKKLPPGPPAVPYLGSIPFLGKDVLKSFMEMRSKYGNIYTVGLPNSMVILNGYEAIREAFVVQGNAFLGRPKGIFLVKEITKGYGKLAF